MPTLLMRLHGPMQAWGTQSRFTRRDAGREPSKSGVLGLIASALGRPRDGDISDLARLRMGVRVDREGVPRTDFQTAGGGRASSPPELRGVHMASGGYGKTVVSQRDYLADADFLVGLEGEEDVLLTIDLALKRPRWPLFLGRKSFVPSIPVAIVGQPPWGPAIRPHGLEKSLLTYPWRWEEARRGALPERLRLVVEASRSQGDAVRQDLPISFATREFAARSVITSWLEVTAVAVP
jgi:CRISPR system Cascade subunit CasD